MRIQSEVTIKDLVDLHESAAARSKVYRSWIRQGKVTSAIFSALIWSILGFICLLAGWPASVVLVIATFAVLLGASISVFIYPGLIRRRLYAFYGERFGGRESFPFEIELREDGIWTQQLGEQNLFEWSNVEEMEVKEDAIHIYAYGGRVVGLRKNDFASTEEEQLFIDTARQYLNASRNASNWIRTS
jgi:hypothetical protein